MTLLLQDEKSISNPHFIVKTRTRCGLHAEYMRIHLLVASFIPGFINN